MYYPKGENPEKPLVDFTFPRTYVSTLKELFLKNELHKLFLPLFMILLGIFEDEYEKILKKALNNSSLENKESTSGFSFTGSSLKYYHRLNQSLDFSVWSK